MVLKISYGAQNDLLIVDVFQVSNYIYVSYNFSNALVIFSIIGHFKYYRIWLTGGIK